MSSSAFKDLNPDQLKELENLKNDENAPKTVRRRAEGILYKAEGLTHAEVAERVGVDAHTVGNWCRGYQVSGITGIKNTSGGDHKNVAQINSATPSALTGITADPIEMSKASVSEVTQISTENWENACPGQTVSKMVKIEGGKEAIEKLSSKNSQGVLHYNISEDGVLEIKELVEIKEKIIDNTNIDTFSQSLTEHQRSIYEALRIIFASLLTCICMKNIKTNYDDDYSVRELESRFGRIKIQVPSTLSKTLPARERLWDLDIRQYIINLSAEVSYRKVTEYANGFYFRKQNDQLQYRTIHKMCIRNGKRCEEMVKKKTKDTLNKYGFDENGKLIHPEMLPEEITKPIVQEEDYEAIFIEIAEKIQDFNDSRKNKDEKINFNDLTKDVFHTEKNTVTIFIDQVLIKKQKEERKKKEDKEEVSSQQGVHWIEVTNACIVSKEGTYLVTAMSIDDALTVILAYLLDNNLLADRETVFFTDGEKTLNTSIEEHFLFRPIKIKLDWFHFHKKIYEYFTMCLYGGKKNKERNAEIRSQFFRKAFPGNIEEAKNFLDTIDKDIIKDYDYIEKIKSYINRKMPYLYNYQIAKLLKSFNSSNLAETANNRIISDRCKRNGTAWSKEGIESIKNTKSIKLNNNTDNWYLEKNIENNPKPLSDKLHKRMDQQVLNTFVVKTKQ